MAGSVSSRRQVLQAVGATILTGGLTYVFLGAVSRSLGDAAFDAFSVYWSLSLIIGFGLFLPIEQELARLGGRGIGPAALGRSGIRVSLEVAGASIAVLGLASPVLLILGARVDVLLVAAGFIVVSAFQFAVRGLLLGSGRLPAYSGVLVLDSVLRVILAVALALVTAAMGVAPTGVEFALALMVAILLAHVPLLTGALRRRMDRAGPSPTPTIRAALLTLVAGTLAAQVMLNIGPILIDLARVGEGLAGAFQATFSVARIPLFILIPLQGALVTPLTKLVAAGRAHRMTVLMSRIAAGIAILALVGALVGWWLGVWAIELVFGPGRALDPVQIAILVAGVCVHAGLVVSVQALVAAERHSRSTLAWIAAIAAFAAVTAATWNQVGAVTAVATAFAVGSLVGWGVALVELRSIGRAAAAQGGAPTTATPPTDPDADKEG